MIRKLTEQAIEDRADFNLLREERGCSCFQVAPCSVCVHPGNPENQENDESCWEETEENN